MSSHGSTANVTQAQTRPISVEEEQRWNRMSNTMSHFHDMFKEEFNNIYNLADCFFEKRNMSLSRYLAEAKQFDMHLTVHHSLEERHLFPILAKQMPAFSKEGSDGHVASHKAIHEGLHQLAALVARYSLEPSSYSPQEMRACLDGFREVLFEHLDEEVADLSGENMRKYWSLEEMDGMLI